MLKLIHAADLHLDSPFAGLRPERAAQRRREQRKLLERGYENLPHKLRLLGANIV